MKDFKTNWTREELKIYTLIYCANADFKESRLETDYIMSKIVESDYDELKKELLADSRHISVHKIMHTLERHGFSSDETEEFLDEIRDIFIADGKFHSLEQQLHSELSNIIRTRLD